MRLKSELWVQAYVRRVLARGGFAATTRRGDADGGMIFIKIARLDGTAALYGPAPAGLGTDPMERLFCRLGPGSADAPAEDRQIDAYIARQAEFDSDCWVIEVEDREGRHFLDYALVEAP